MATPTINRGRQEVPDVRPITRYWKKNGEIFHDGGYAHGAVRTGADHTADMPAGNTGKQDR